jgi:hypothetical protein
VISASSAWRFSKVAVFPVVCTKVRASIPLTGPFAR